MAKIPQYRPRVQPSVSDFRLPPTPPTIPAPNRIAPQPANVQPLQAKPSGAEGLSQIANRLQSLAVETHQKQQKQRDKQAMATLSTDFSIGASETLREMQQNSEPGAPNFVDDFEAQVVELQNSLLEQAPSEDVRQALELRMRTERARLMARAHSFQMQAQDAQARVQIAENTRRLENQVARDFEFLPTAMGELTQNLLAAQEFIGVTGSGNFMKTKDQLRERLYTAAFKGLIDRDPADAAEKLMSGKYDALVEVQPLLGDAKTELERRHKKEVASIRSMFPGAVQTALRTGQLPGYFEERVRATGDPDLIAQFEGEILPAVKAGQVTKDAPTMSPVEMQAKLNELKPSSSTITESTDEQWSIYSHVANEFATQMERRQDEPAQVVLESDSAVMRIYQDAQEDPGLWGAYAQATWDEQVRLGVQRENRQILPPTDAARIVSRIQELPAGDRGQFMAEMLEGYGKWKGQALRDLVDAGLDPQSRAFPHISHNRVLTREYGKYLEDPESIEERADSRLKQFGETTTSENYVDLHIEDNTDWQEFVDVVAAGEPTGGRAKELQDIKSQISTLAKGRISRGDSPPEAVESAVKDFISRNYTIIDEDNFQVYLPKSNMNPNISEAQVKRKARFMQTRQQLEEFNPEPGGSVVLEALGEEWTRDQLIDRAVSHGVWINDGSGRGVMLAVPIADGQIMWPFAKEGPNGEEIVYGFDMEDTAITINIPGSAPGADQGGPNPMIQQQESGQ